jgi:hypothetical protein
MRSLSSLGRIQEMRIGNSLGVHIVKTFRCADGARLTGRSEGIPQREFRFSHRFAEPGVSGFIVGSGKQALTEALGALRETLSMGGGR